MQNKLIIDSTEHHPEVVSLFNNLIETAKKEVDAVSGGIHGYKSNEPEGVLTKLEIVIVPNISYDILAGLDKSITITVNDVESVTIAISLEGVAHEHEVYSSTVGFNPFFVKKRLYPHIVDLLDEIIEHQDNDELVPELTKAKQVYLLHIHADS